MSSYQKKPQNPNNFIVFDTETGGVDPKVNPITEIALIAYEGDTFNKVDEYQGLILPYSDDLKYEQKAFDVSNLSFEILEAEGVSIQEVAERTLQLFAAANTKQEKSPGLKPILIGHNVAFDLGFLHHLLYYGIGKGYQDRLEQLLHGRRDFYGNFQPTYLDTHIVTKSWLQGEKELTNYKLGTVTEKLGIDINNAHRAMNDTVSTAEILRVCLNNLRNGLNNIGSMSSQERFGFPI